MDPPRMMISFKDYSMWNDSLDKISSINNKEMQFPTNM